jgi:cell division protein ZapE
MNLHDQYAVTLQEHGFAADPAQLAAIDKLAGIRAALCAAGPVRTRGGSLAKLGKLLGRQKSAGPVRGLYMWGGVGRGKTFVMDVFFASLPFNDKLRFHFHRLMYRVHKQLAELKDEVDPIDKVAANLAGQARVICFDEFFVTDIGDAMILGRLLSALFDRGVCLVATSNIVPAQLYAGGLQHQRFLPAIDLLTEHTEVFELDAGNDYRLRVLEQAELWHMPASATTEQRLDDFFCALAPDSGTQGLSIEILGRDIVTRRRAEGVAWFDFAELCDGPRSKDDYIELARAFQTVLISDIPELDGHQDDQARRFIALIDEFYDRRVKICASAATPIEDIYTGTRLAAAFKRTASRLSEMQSTRYLAAAHIT